MSNIETIEWEQNRLRYVGPTASAEFGGRPDREWLRIAARDTRKSERQIKSMLKAVVDSDKPTSIWIAGIQHCPGELRDLRLGDPKIKKQAIDGMAFQARIAGEMVLESGVTSEAQLDRISEPQAHF